MACSAPGYRADVNVIDLDAPRRQPAAHRPRPAGRWPPPDAVGAGLLAHDQGRHGDVRRRRPHRRPPRPPRARRPARRDRTPDRPARSAIRPARPIMHARHHALDHHHSSQEEHDMGKLDGRIAIITGAGRGIGREHSLLFASEGAKVVVNDLGGGTDGAGADASAAQQVVDEITAAGGEAVASHHDVADAEQAKAMIDLADRHVRRRQRARQQRRHPARPHGLQHERRRVGRRRPGPPARPLPADEVRRRSTGASRPRPART